MSMTPGDISALARRIRLHNWGANVEDYAFPSEIADALDAISRQLQAGRTRRPSSDAEKRLAAEIRVRVDKRLRRETPAWIRKLAQRGESRND